MFGVRKTRPVRKPPRTRRGLPPGAPLLVGRLEFHPARAGSPPSLTLSVWCPYCRRAHRHGWPDLDARLDAVGHRVAHCGPDSPLGPGGYFIGLDPAEAAPNRRALQQCLAARGATPEAVT